MLHARYPNSTYLISLLGALATVITTAVFWPGLSGGFIFDDTHALVYNPAVHLDRLDWASLRAVWESFIHGPSGRPLVMLSFGLEHYFFGLDPFVFKLTNLLLHMLNAALIGLLALRLFQSGSVSSTPNGWILIAALSIALLWAIHPLQVSTVLYAIQRMEIMALTFILLALLAYWHGRRIQIEGRGNGWPWFAGVFAATLLALLCKETGLLVPAFAFCLELTLLRFRAASRRTQNALRTSYAIVGVAVIGAFLFVILPAQTTSEAYASRAFSWQERILTQLRVLPMYLGWIIWPDPQNYLFYYDSLEPSRSLLEPRPTFLGGLMLSFLALTAFLLRTRTPLAALGILLFFTAHFLTSNVYPLELAFEHRNYFAIFGVLLVAFDGVHRLNSGYFSLPLKTLFLTVIIGFGTITALHSGMWGDRLALAMDLRAKNPTSERANYDLAEIYRVMSNQNPNSPFFEMAMAAFENAAKLQGASPLPEHALIAMHAIADREVDPDWWNALVDKVEDGPRGAQQITAVRTLLQLHNAGHPIDPDPLMDAGIALLNKPRLSPTVHVEFGLHALEALDEPGLAGRILITASRIAADASFDANLIEVLEARGQESFAATLRERLAEAAEKGITP